MFKKLKEKISEEVKISPQRFVEMTQSVSNRLQSTSTSDDNFFSIGDDDTSVDSNNQGFSSVQLMSPQEGTRKNSTSSLASDTSFLPKYEPSTMYHLQSDLDVSASEVEDNVSTASSQLGHVTKEQIFAAFKKTQMGYHKYRGRYTDLSRHYKDLERENAKMKSILVETQDKAIRRVFELKEQCSLEQKAKAHLEGALRDEMDEKNYKIKSLQTKIELLQGENISNSSISIEENSNNVSENLENLTKHLNESRKEIETLNSKIQELKANTIVFQSKEHEYKTKISNLEKEIVQFSEREKENNLNLAQNKMELHNEIIIKDNEMANLKRDNESLKHTLEILETENKSNNNQKLENLQSQNKKLIERIESLTQKCNNLENEALKVETYKLEIKNAKQTEEDRFKQIVQLEKTNEDLMAKNLEVNQTLLNERDSYEAQISQLREDAKKGLISLEPKIREKLQKEFMTKEEQLQNDFVNKIEELSSKNDSTKEIQLQLIEKENVIKKLDQELDQIKAELFAKSSSHNELENNHLELIDDCTRLRNTITNLEKDQLTLDTQQEKISRLEAHLNTLQEELKISDYNRQKAVLKLTAIEEKVDLQSSNESFALTNLQEEKNNLLEQFEFEKGVLNRTIDNYAEEIVQLKTVLDREKELNIQTSNEKSNLEKDLIVLQEKFKLLEKKEIADSESKLLIEEAHNKNIELFETQREFLATGLGMIWKILGIQDDNTYEVFSHADLEQKLNLLTQMCEKKYNLYNDTLAENNKLLGENMSKSQQIKTLQNELDNLHNTTDSFKLHEQELLNELKKKEQKLEENHHLIENIEYGNHIKISELESLLAKEKDVSAKLLNENSVLEKHIKQLEENSQEQTYSVDLVNSKYAILDQKVCKLEEINQTLSQTLQNERDMVEKANKDYQDSSFALETKHFELKELYEKAKLNVDTSNERIQELEEEILRIKEDKQVIVQELGDIRVANEILRAEKEEKDQELIKLSTNVASLSTTVEKQTMEFNKSNSETQDLKAVIEKMEKDAIEKEKDSKNESSIKINELEVQLANKTTELAHLNKKLSELETLYRADEDKFNTKITEVDDLVKEMKSKSDEIKNKDQEIYILKEERDSAVEEINTLRGEIEELSKEISRKGVLDTKLVHSESERELLKTEREKIKDEMAQLNIRIQQLSMDYRNILEENQNLSQEKEQLKMSLVLLKDQQDRDSSKTVQEDNVNLNNVIKHLELQLSSLEAENTALKDQKNPLDIDELTGIRKDFCEIKETCDDLFMENKSLKQEYINLGEKCNNFKKIKETLEGQMSELEGHYNELVREKQLLEDEVQELKTSPVNYQNNSSRLDNLEILKTKQTLLEDAGKQHYAQEIEILRDKLTKYKSLDLTNKSSIEFYENELQKMKNQNDKLNRKLDETLVTLNHCAELSTSTEVEYLRNVLYNYMLGKESVVLARVIAAVCKFDPKQTELILQKEHQRQTLLGQLGLI